MANYIETKSTKPILSRVSYVGEYAYDVFGYVGGYLDDLNISHKNNKIIVASGLIAVDGKRIVINDEMSITLPYESGGGMMEYNLFLKVNMATPDNLSLVTSVAYANPVGYRDDDLFLNYDNGIKFIKLATIVNSSAGIQSVEKVIPSIKEEKEKFAFDTGWVDLISGGGYIETGSDSKIRRIGKVVYLIFNVKTTANIPQGTGVQTHLIPSKFRPSKTSTLFTVGIPSSKAFYNCSLDIYPGYITFKCPSDDIRANIWLRGTAMWLID